MKKLKGMFGLWVAVVVAAAMLAVPTFAVGTGESGEGEFEPWVGPLSTGGSSTTPTVYYYTIESSSNDGGSISPEGYASVVMGGNKTFTITPDEGMFIKDVLVDGESVGAVESYTFENVWERHTIEVVFSKWSSTYDGCPQDGTCPVAAYSDADPSEWYHNGLHFCVENGLLVGSDGKLNPDGEATRAMIAVMLWRVNGCPQVEGEIPFKDVDEGDWYADAARWAKSEGIVLGYGDGTHLGPDDPILREQLITILWRYAQWQGHDVSEGEGVTLDTFADASDVSGYAIPAIQWAAATGMLAGVDAADGGKLIDPQGQSTRAQLATFVMRHLESQV